jgi:hypothetical protein
LLGCIKAALPLYKEVSNTAADASGHFAQPDPNHYNKTEPPLSRRIMPLSGEAIRLMNYIDDVAVTLRRVMAAVPTLSAEERAKVADHLLNARPSVQEVAEALAAK